MGLTGQYTCKPFIFLQPVIREEYIEIIGGEIPISLYVKDEKEYHILVDGIEWVNTTNRTHAIVLFEMMWDNLTDYVNYRIK